MSDNVHPQFDFADSDIVLRSSDLVLFRVHRLLLKMTSTVFAGMIELPRSDREHDSKGVAEPVLLTEPSLVIAFIFAAIYPNIDLPTLTSFADARAIADATEKYDIPCALKRLKDAVVKYETFTSQTNAVGLYSLAKKCNWEDIVASASKKTLSMNLTQPTKENAEQIVELTKDELLPLLRLHAARKQHIQHRLDNKEEITNFKYTFQLSEYWSCKCRTSVFKDEGCRNIERAFRSFKNTLAGYLEREPIALALTSQLTRTSSTLEDLIYPLKMMGVKCTKCQLEFLNEVKLRRVLRETVESAPATVFDVPEDWEPRVPVEHASD